MDNYIISEVAADEMITNIRDLKQDKSRFETIAHGKINNIQEQLQRATEKIDMEIQYNKDQLRAFFLTVDKKSTKTQETYSLLSGKLVLKKPTMKIAHDDSKILEWANENASEYVKQTITNKLDWATFKKDLDIDNGLIVNKVTGEELSTIEGLSLEEVGEVFDIK